MIYNKRFTKQFLWQQNKNIYISNKIAILLLYIILSFQTAENENVSISKLNSFNTLFFLLVIKI